MESMDLICLNLMYKDSSLQKKLAGDYQCCESASTSGGKDKAQTLDMIRGLFLQTPQGPSQQTSVRQPVSQTKPDTQSTIHNSNTNRDFICEER